LQYPFLAVFGLPLFARSMKSLLISENPPFPAGLREATENRLRAQPHEARTPRSQPENRLPAPTPRSPSPPDPVRARTSLSGIE
jgi:hypothetical protein